MDPAVIADSFGCRTAGVARALVVSASLLSARVALPGRSHFRRNMARPPRTCLLPTCRRRRSVAASRRCPRSSRSPAARPAQNFAAGLSAGSPRRGKVRLEAPAPFGRPIFTLVARGETATLVLNRDCRVVRYAVLVALVEALAGVSMGADDLKGAVAGCGFSGADLAGGESYPGDSIAGDAGGARAWLRKVDGAWRLVATARGPLEIRYDQFVSGRPSVVQLRSTAQGNPSTDVTLRLSQVDINVPLEDSVFDVEVPADAQPMTLDELRRSGTLGSTSGSDGSPSGGEPERQ